MVGATEGSEVRTTFEMALRSSRESICVNGSSAMAIKEAKGGSAEDRECGEVGRKVF